MYASTCKMGLKIRANLKAKGDRHEIQVCQLVLSLY